MPHLLKQQALPGVVYRVGTSICTHSFILLIFRPQKTPKNRCLRSNMQEPKNPKKKVGLYLDSPTYEEVKQTYRKDGCRSLTEFMERAVEYYIGYVNSEQITDYLSPVIVSSVKAVSDENTKRITRILFKLAVETAVMNNLFAASLDISEEQINTLRRECEKEVRKTSGDFSMNDAVRWQKR